MSLETWRDWFGWLIMAAVSVSTVVSFVMSYRGLLDWATHHGYPSGWAFVFPLSVDLFIIVGEATLFRAVHDHWTTWERVPAWCSIGCGLVASVAGNAHVAWFSPVATRVTLGVPPAAMTAMLALGLTVLKHEMSRQAPKPPTKVVARPRTSNKPAPVVGGAPEPECVHASIPRGLERVPVAIEHFQGCVGEVPGTNPIAEWTGVPRTTLRRHLNGHLAEAREG